MIYGKIFDIYPPLMDDFLIICDQAYEEIDFIVMEGRILE